jgi:hypothetical protein
MNSFAFSSSVACPNVKRVANRAVSCRASSAEIAELSLSTANCGACTLKGTSRKINEDRFDYQVCSLTSEQRQHVCSASSRESEQPLAQFTALAAFLLCFACSYHVLYRGHLPLLTCYSAASSTFPSGLSRNCEARFSCILKHKGLYFKMIFSFLIMIRASL